MNPMSKSKVHKEQRTLEKSVGDGVSNTAEEDQQSGEDGVRNRSRYTAELITGWTAGEQPGAGV